MRPFLPVRRGEKRAACFPVADTGTYDACVGICAFHTQGGMAKP
jgi:hypothetical protein